MLNAVLARHNPEMPIDFQDLLLRRNQTNDWLSCLKVNHAASRLLSEPGPSVSMLDQHARPSLNRSPSSVDTGSWSEGNIRSSDDVFRSAGKSGKSERYKTELCRSFEETGFCKYKEKCQFAHGMAELRNVQRHPKYKTDRCRTYHSTGFCPYGSRCHFIHEEQMSPTETSLPVLGGGGGGSGGTQLPRPPKAVEPEAPLDQSNVSVSREQLEQFLEAFNRVLQVVSGGNQPCQSPSPTLPNFEVTSRQDSVSSGSLRSSPDRLPTETALMRDDIRMPFSRFASCSSDFDGYGPAVFSPTSPTAPFGLTPQEPSAFSSVWTRTIPN